MDFDLIWPLVLSLSIFNFSKTSWNWGRMRKQISKVLVSQIFQIFQMEHLPQTNSLRIPIFLFTLFEWNHLGTPMKVILCTCLDHIHTLHYFPFMASCPLLQKMIWKTFKRSKFQSVFLLTQIQAKISGNLPYMDNCMKTCVCITCVLLKNFLSLGKTYFLHCLRNSLTWICNFSSTFQKLTQ